MSADDLVTLRSDLDPTEAYILKARLEADGIRAYLLGAEHVQADWTVAIALGGVRLQVRARDQQAAANILAAMERGEYKLPDTD